MDNSNLVPQSERTKDEQREIARQGSISSRTTCTNNGNSKKRKIHT